MTEVVKYVNTLSIEPNRGLCQRVAKWFNPYFVVVSREHFGGVVGIAREVNNVSMTRFDNCICNLESTLQFENAFDKSPTGKVDSLEICGYSTRFGKPTAAVLVNILGPTSTLKELKLADLLC